MSPIALIAGTVVILVALIVAFFAWANARTRRAHAGFKLRDVEIALEEFVSPAAADHGTWDLFRSWPIDDPYLESVRQRCRDLSEGQTGAEEKVRAMLAELRQHT